MKFLVKDIAQIVSGNVVGDENESIHTFSKIDKAVKGSITFLGNQKYSQYLFECKASAVIVNKSDQHIKPPHCNLIEVEDAYNAFSKILQVYEANKTKELLGIHPLSFIGSDTEYGDGFFIDAFTKIGNHVRIGNHVKILANCTIADSVQIGNNCMIHPNVTIYPNTVIGNNVVLHAGVVLGGDGFGFLPQADGSYNKIPQLGNVIIEDDVEIGANSTIDCATIGSTHIKKGVKLDNLVHLAHNVEIDENTVIAAQTGVAGSTKIGKQVIIGGQTGIAGHVNIGNHSMIQGQSGVIYSLPEYSKVYGTPAINIMDYKRSYVLFKNLPSLTKRIEKIEKSNL